MNGHKSLAVPAAAPSTTWIDPLAPSLLRRAASVAPERLRERLEEEWLAHFAHHEGLPARLRFLLGCFWAAIIMGHENPLAAAVPAASPRPLAAQATVAAPGPRKRSAPHASGFTVASDRVMSEMNITPLIDVMLVLLVTLIVSLPTMTHAVKLDLSGGAPVAQAGPPAVIDLEIDSDGTMAWNGTALTNLVQLERRFESEAGKDPQAEIHLRPERRVRYDIVAKVLAAAQRSHMEKLSFANTAEFAN